MSMKDFQIISRLGDGSYSSVWKVKRLSDGEEYAMKKVKLAALSEKEKENALNEVRILASINDPNIIGYKESFLEDNSMILCIVMEYAAGGDLYNKIVQHQKNGTYFTEEDIWSIFINMIKGLKTLHDLKILHRDLKCANIFIGSDGKTAKLGDLNVSKVAKGNLAYTQTGTPYYASPEVWKDKPYDAKSDIWSLGCVLYEIATLKPPFRANDMEGLYKKVQKGNFDRIPSQYSSDLFNIICQCLQVHPAMRPTCDNLLSNPIIIRHCRGLIPQSPQKLNGGKIELLKTIKMPRNPKTLSQQLPRANYRANQSADSARRQIAKPEGNSLVSLIKGNEKRAVSQQASIANNNIHIRQSQSQENRNKILEKESEMEYLQRMQREYIDRAKIIRNIPMPNLQEVNQGRDKYIMNSPNLNPTKNGSSPKALAYPTSGVNSSSNSKRDQILTPIDKISRQAELINKYQNRANEIGDRLSKLQIHQNKLNEKENIYKKADILLEKYQHIAAKGHNQPLQPLILNTRLPTPPNYNNPKDLIGRYNNNIKDKYDNTPEYGKKPYERDLSSPYVKKVEAPLKYIDNSNSQGGLVKQSGLYQYNYNHIKVQPIVQKNNKVVWWN